MANFSNNNLLGNQKRRNFIYNPVAPRSRDSSSLTAQPGSSSSGVQLRANVHRESPYKKFKSSHGLPDKRAEEIAAEEACRDLPLDAFDEEFDAIEDDFDDDDLLTAEQLDECDRIASMKLETECKIPLDFSSNLSPRNEKCSCSSKNAFSSAHLGPEEVVSDENDDTKNTQDYVVGPTAATSSVTHFSLSDTAGFPVSNSRELRAPIVTYPQESASMEYARPLKKSDSLLDSFVDQCNGSASSRAPSSHVHVHTVGGNSSVSKTSLNANNRNDNCPVTRHPEDAQLQNLRKEIERLKGDFATASSRVKTLEEEKFCKDGEIKILRDSLEHYQTDEKKRQGEEKAVQEQRAREQSQHEKELKKQVENLTTQIRFKEREISQMIEQNKKRTASLTEGNSSSPKKKTVNLSEVFPTGSSFFQKTSPEAKARSPRCIKQSSKDLKTQNKQNSQKLSEGENSENSTLSGTSSSLSTVERMKVQQRETDVSEREIVQLFAESSPEVELVQNLLSPHEKELQSLFPDAENRTLNEGSIISLLMLNRPSANSHPAMQKTTLSETDVSHTLRLFETQATSKLQRSISTSLQKDSFISCDNTLVIQTLSGLLNHCQVDSDSKDLTPTSNLKDRHDLPTAVNFLPLLENHIVHYVEQRTETNDDNILSTCLPRSSPTQDLLEPKDSSGFESEHAKNLAALQTTALTALRLLNILVFYSCEVCECILKSARAYSDSSEEDNDRVMETKGKRTKVEICVAFCMLFFVIFLSFIIFVLTSANR